MKCERQQFHIQALAKLFLRCGACKLYRLPTRDLFLQGSAYWQLQPQAMLGDHMTLADIRPRAMVLDEMHNTSCYDAIRRRQMDKCKDEALNILTYATALMFQGTRTRYIMEESVDMTPNGVVLSKIHTNHTADTLYAYLTITPDRFAQFDFSQSFGVKTIAVVRMQPQLPWFDLNFTGVSAGLHWSVFAMFLLTIVVLTVVHSIANVVHHRDGTKDIWPFLSQMIPDWDAPPIREEPGAAGRVLRVTVGLGSFLIVAYYESLLLQYLLM